VASFHQPDGGNSAPLPVGRPALQSFAAIAILRALMLVPFRFAEHHYLVDMIAGAVVTVSRSTVGV
jgi:hypothetical protein